MTWPQATDYNAAVQNPQLCFRDDDLRQGQAAGALFGLPCPHSGNFADVYQIQGADNQGWAVKCFTRPVTNLHQRYQAISGHLRQTQRAFMVEFHFLEEGICIRGQWYPIVKMRWVEGFRLNEFIRAHLDKTGLLERMAQLWVRLAQELRDAQMAHGDLQHGNVLLVPGSKSSSLALRLIDYDGMFVPSLSDTPSGEVGHPNYQHPQRLREGGYGRGIDNFAHLLIYTALRCLRVGGAELWDHYDNSENLLFREEDFRQPGQSLLLRELWRLKDRDARDLVGHLLLASQGPLSVVPALDELVEESVVRPLSGEAEGQVNALLGDEPAARTVRIKRAAPTMTAIELAPAAVATGAAKSIADTQTIALDSTAPRMPTPPPLPPSIRNRAGEIVKKGRPPAAKKPSIDLSRLTDPLVAILSRPAWLAALGAVALVSFLVVNVLVWSTVKPPLAPPVAARPTLAPLEDFVLRGGQRREITFAVERNHCRDPLTIHVDGLPADLKAPVLTVAPEQEAVALPLVAPLDVEVPPREVFVSLWQGGERLQEARFRLAIRKVPRPLLRQPESIRCKAGAAFEFIGDVDRRDCSEPLTLRFEKLPAAIHQESLPDNGKEPPRVKLTVAADAALQEPISATLTLHVGDVVADTKSLFFIVEKPGSRVRLTNKGPDTVTIKAGEKGELLVFVERKDYTGPVEIRLTDPPPGVKAPAVVMRPEISFATVRIEAEVDAKTGRYVLQIQSWAEGLRTDERDITLTVEAKPAPAAAVQEARGGKAERVTFASVDGVQLAGTLYHGSKGKQGACVLMLHELGQHRRTPGWVRLAQALQAEGHTVLTFDFRGHGESRRIAPDFWKVGVNRHLPAFRQTKEGDPLPDTFDARDLPPSYLPWLIHDIAAARMFLDSHHDDRDSPINSYNLLLLGAGSGSTVGSLWLATEGFRFNALRVGVAIQADWVKNRDILRAVWLGVDRKWKGFEYPLASWIRTAYRPHADTDPNAVVPIEFVFGAEDIDAYRLVSELVAGGVGDSHPILGTRLAGSQLLEKSGESERHIRNHLVKTLANARLREWSPRRSDTFRSLWGIPHDSKMDFFLARQPGEHILREVPLKRFKVHVPGLAEPHPIGEGKGD
jgi:hypothetical protein